MKAFYYISICLFFVCSCNIDKVQNDKVQAEIIEYAADDYYNQGLDDYYAEKYEEAFENFEKAISIDSTIADYYVARGMIKNFYNDTIGEFNDYMKAIQLDTLNAIAYYNIGCLTSDAGYDSIAIEYYDLAKRIDPEYYPVYHNMAISQYALKRYEAALKNFRISAQYNPGATSNDYYYMGLIYKETGRSIHARQYMKKAEAMGEKNAGRVLLEWEGINK